MHMMMVAPLQHQLRFQWTTIRFSVKGKCRYYGYCSKIVGDECIWKKIALKCSIDAHTEVEICIFYVWRCKYLMRWLLSLISMGRSLLANLWAPDYATLRHMCQFRIKIRRLLFSIVTINEFPVTAPLPCDARKTEPMNINRFAHSTSASAVDAALCITRVAYWIPNPASIVMRARSLASSPCMYT